MKTAIVYDYVPQLGGGAERALIELIKHFPNDSIDVYFGFCVSSEYSKRYIQKIEELIGNEHILIGPKISFLKPIAFRIMNFLLPSFYASYNLQSYDLVISYTAFIAHAIIPPVKGKHIVYMNTPARFLWNLEHAKSLLKDITSPFLITDIMRYRSQFYDLDGITRTKKILAISQATAMRINSFYNRNSEILYPASIPDELLKQDFENQALKNELGTYFTHISRIESYKNIDLVLDAAIAGELSETVVIMGGGPYLNALKNKMNRQKGVTFTRKTLTSLNITVEQWNNIIFTDYIEESNKMTFLANASASFSLNDEDFGITKIESLAVGTPVIGLAAGATPEIIKEGKNGTLFDHATVAGLIDAIKKHKEIIYSKNTIKESARKFTNNAFHSNLEKILHA